MRPLRSTQAKPLTGTLDVPGDKSISHRSLMLGSQISGMVHIDNMLEGEDVLNTAHAMRALGVKVKHTGPGSWQVTGVGIGGLQEPGLVLDMGNSGTGTRLMMGLVASYPFTTFFSGDASLHGRPMARVIKPLENMGARIVARSQGRLPLAVVGAAKPVAITYRLPVPSAQVKSAILLAALNIPGKTTVIEPEATRDHTERMLQHFGIPVETSALDDGARVITLEGRPAVKAQDSKILVPGDPSSAAFPAVAALLCPGSDLTLRNLCINPLRTGLYQTLAEMGASIDYLNKRVSCGENVADLRIRASSLKGITVPAERAPSMIDEYPILAVAAACAKGRSTFHGLSELRVKESDRFNAIVDGLNACGVTVVVDGDSMSIDGVGGAPRGGASIHANLDHRIAMSFLVMGMVSQQPVAIDDADTINTSFPGFVTLMNGLGARITDVSGKSASPPLVIAIDGPAASGKGTLARRLAEHFGYACLDTGGLYRAVGLKLVYSHQDPEDEKAAIAAAHAIDEEDLANPRLRQERIGQAASIVSAIPGVRAALLDFQRRFAAKAGGAILDGRDIGTVVCPNADVKIFITASLEARAKRRHRELQGEGIRVDYDSVLSELETRDARDRTREAAPLIAAQDAITIDTSELDANSVFKKVVEIVEARLGK